jgi:hypothetical protein
MASRERQQYWTRDAIESIKASFRRQDPIVMPKPKPAQHQATILDGGCLLYRLGGGSAPLSGGEDNVDPRL